MFVERKRKSYKERKNKIINGDNKRLSYHKLQ